MAVVFVIMLPQQEVYDSSGTSSDVLTSTASVKQYLRDKYGDDATIVAGEETKINTSNYCQTYLNSYYKTTTGTAVEGTCSEVAATSLIEFYSDLDGFTTNSSFEDTFVDIVNIALAEGYYEVGEGTSQTELDNLLEDSFEYYGSSNGADNDYFNLYKTICSKVNSGVPVLFSIIGHTMVACGYVTYTTTYTSSKNKETTATDNFIIVNDGWSNSRQYSYFPEDSISTNIFTRWEFCITKVT